MIVNILLGIRYFFTHRGLVPICLRVIQLVNMIVNTLLGIRHFIHPSCPLPPLSYIHYYCLLYYQVFFTCHCALVPIFLRVIHTVTVSQYDCQRSIRYFSPIVSSSSYYETHTVGQYVSNCGIRYQVSYLHPLYLHLHSCESYIVSQCCCQCGITYFINPPIIPSSPF